MRTYHNKQSTKPPAADPSIVQSLDWNDVQPGGSVPQLYTASGIVPITVDFIRANGGSAGIALQLTEGVYVTQTPNGAISIYQRYEAIKIDADVGSGGGAVVFSDPSGALFNGDPTYSFVNQWQWAIFIWNGTSWDVIGN